MLFNPYAMIKFGIVFFGVIYILAFALWLVISNKRRRFELGNIIMGLAISLLPAVLVSCLLMLVAIFIFIVSNEFNP